MLVIVPRPGCPIDHLTNWAEFHGIPWVSSDNTECEPIQELSIVITSDLYPTAVLMRALLDGISYASQDISSHPFEDGIWRSSFCIITRDPHCYSNALDAPEKLQHIPGMSVYTHLAPKVDELMWKAGTKPTEEERCDVLFHMVNKYWYSCSQQLVSKYYVHMWTNACQLLHMQRGDYHNSVYTSLRRHAVFGNAVRNVNQSTSTVGEVVQYLEKGIPLQDAVDETLKGISVDIPGHNPRGHILSVNGMVTLNRKQELTLAPSETTVVSMYYPLGYSDKPNDAYMDSIRLFARIPHPLVFYSSPEVCDEVHAIRDDLGLLTKTVVRALEEWELPEMYPEVFEDVATEKGMKASGKYAVMTCTKFWALREVASENPFNTPMIAWLDCGIYRHKHIAPKSLAGERLFEHAYKNATVGKVSVPSMSMFPGTTLEEYKSGDEYVVAIAMFGDVNAWLGLCSKFIDFVIMQMAEGNVWTEQVMLSRIAGIFPTLIRPVFYGYNQSQFMRVLGYE